MSVISSDTEVAKRVAGRSSSSANVAPASEASCSSIPIYASIFDHVNTNPPFTGPWFKLLNFVSINLKELPFFVHLFVVEPPNLRAQLA